MKANRRSFLALMGTTLIAPRSAAYAPYEKRVLSNRTHQYDAASEAGTYICQNVRRAHQAPASTAIADFQLGFGNWYISNPGGGTTEYPLHGALNEIFVKATIESEGACFPVLFGDSQAAAIKGGATVLCNPIAEVPAGSTFFSNTMVWLSSNAQSWPVIGGTSAAPYPEAMTQPSMGEGAVSTTDVQDWTRRTIPPSASIAYGPCLIVSRGNSAVSSVALFGDSIGDGFGEGAGYTPTGSVDPNGLTGYLARGLQNVVGWTKFTHPGDDYVSRAASNNHQSSFGALAGRHTHAVIGLGTNDVDTGRSLATIQVAAAAFWNALAYRGVKVWACTVPPVTTSTDSWLTTGNQTVLVTESVRVAFNNWIRTAPAPLSGYFEVADALETARNSGIWKVVAGNAQGYTPDGIHCSTFGYKQGATAINPLLLN